MLIHSLLRLAQTVAIIAKTVKGKGVSFLEDKNGWHGKALSKDELAKALAELGEVDKTIRGIVQTPALADTFGGSGTFFSAARQESSLNEVPLPKTGLVRTPSKAGLQVAEKNIPFTSYNPSIPVATRKAFGNALVRLAPLYPNMLVLDGDVKNSTYTELFAEKFPDRFLECYIAEQNMVGVALGLARRGFAPWVSTFSCFFTRAFDQIRMAAITGATIRFNGSHAGVSIGQDGPSQMGLEDIALFRSIHGSTVIYPADPFATERLAEEMMKTEGISYIRTNRPETPVIYSKDDEFPVGKSKVFECQNPNIPGPTGAGKCQITVVAAGITLHEALAAQKELAGENIGIRVIDCYSVKPIDVVTLKKAAGETKAIIVVEDHYPEGGLGDAVKSALFSTLDTGNQAIRVDHFIHLAVSKMPRSGKPQELLDFEEIDADAIISAAKKIAAISKSK